MTEKLTVRNPEKKPLNIGRSLLRGMASIGAGMGQLLNIAPQPVRSSQLAERRQHRILGQESQGFLSVEDALRHDAEAIGSDFRAVGLDMSQALNEVQEASSSMINPKQKEK